MQLDKTSTRFIVFTSCCLLLFPLLSSFIQLGVHLSIDCTIASAKYEQNQIPHPSGGKWERQKTASKWCNYCSICGWRAFGVDVDRKKTNNISCKAGLHKARQNGLWNRGLLGQRQGLLSKGFFFHGYVAITAEGYLAIFRAIFSRRSFFFFIAVGCQWLCLLSSFLRRGYTHLWLGLGLDLRFCCCL